MTDWTLDVTRLDAIVPPEGLQAEPSYEDQDPITSHGFPPSLTHAYDREHRENGHWWVCMPRSEAMLAVGTARAEVRREQEPRDSQEIDLRAALAERNVYSRGDLGYFEDGLRAEAADRAVAALTPLVEAAVAWREQHPSRGSLGPGDLTAQLGAAVDAYRAATPEPRVEEPRP